MQIVSLPIRIIKNKLLFLLFALVFCPIISTATVTTTLEIEFAFTLPDALEQQLLGYRLYREGVKVCETNDPNVSKITCDIPTEDGTFDFTLAAYYTDGAESPQSPSFPFTIGSAPVTLPPAPTPDQQPATAVLSSSTAAGALNQTEVSQLYVSIFGRASEGEGNSYWQTGQYGMATTANEMLATTAASDYFGASLNSNQAFIEHIYLNTLSKTLADDPEGISYWVAQLNGGLTRGEVVVNLVGVIEDYAPEGQYYDPFNSKTIAAYYQFTNRVDVSNYMADTVTTVPDDWTISTSFTGTLTVTDNMDTVTTAKQVLAQMAANDLSEQELNYLIVDTNQTKFFNNLGEISEPSAGDNFYGQDANFSGATPNYTDNGDGTISDNITGLMWVKDRGSKVTWNDAVEGANLNLTGGYDDWRMPTIKELYSLFLFSGQNGSDVFSIDNYVPFIDTDYFDFEYGSGIGDERVIDCQDWSATEYVGTTQDDQPTVFGINFADGRLKGYKKYLPPSWTEYNELYVRYVRGNAEYGINNFIDNSDGTISDLATGLMWSQFDSQQGLNWQEALAWIQKQNDDNYLGYNDWRLPNIKELQSIVDYTRSPEATSSPAIDINFFYCSTIVNEAGEVDYPYFWSGTVLVDGPTTDGCYIPFGKAMAYLYNNWQDVHGAGSQKADIMIGNPYDYPNGRGPQGDAVRVYNYVRLVRDLN